MTRNTLLFILALLFLQLIFTIFTATTSPLDIVVRTSTATITGYFMSSKIVHDDNDNRIVAIMAIVTCLVLLAVRNIIKDVTLNYNDIKSVGDVFGMAVGWLISSKGKEKPS